VKGSVKPGSYQLVFTGTDDSGRARTAPLLLVVD